MIEWKGAHRAPGDEVVPADLRVDHVYLVSCKYLSRIVVNASPHHLFDRLLAGVMRVAELEAANGGGFEAARTLAARYRTLVLQGPEGEVRAAALAAEALAR